MMTSLLCLEFLVFVAMLVIYCLCLFYLNSITYFVAMLCTAASGAAVALTLLITISRLYGNDKVSNLLYEKNPWGRSIIKFAKPLKYFDLVEYCFYFGALTSYTNYYSDFTIFTLYCWLMKYL
uniref:NADH dehydrogenase subunit 4L n=1 Tax=Cernuella virgata TaxID=145650 RepID=A0A1B0TKT3_9EUPU|nr:NADH dehydrogenase subunit 4L [Cernuella virgata]